LVALRLLKANLLAWALGIWALLYVTLRFGFVVPIPASVISIYMGIATLALFAYVTSDSARWSSFSGPLLRLTTERSYAPALIGVVLLIPSLVAAHVYLQATAPIEPPFFSRTVHPAPPADITVHDHEVDLITAQNPYRALETSNPQEFRAHVQAGHDVYFRNCVFCHGDNMSANGMFVHGLNPIPTNFTDKGTIAMLQESFLFWRISKGGPGLPEEGGPWDTAMPAWEKFLSEEQIWDVILFLYDFTDQRPRAREGSEAKP
jgi:mono/diheme cytochrome c family protein